MFGNQQSMQAQIGAAINNAILTTAMLANEFCIQTKGEAILSESDYIHIVQDFQVMLSRKIMPPKTQEELKLEIKKYITELITKMNPKESDNDSGAKGQATDSNGTESESKGASSGENGLA